MARPEFLLSLWFDILSAAGTPDFRRAKDRMVVEYKRSTNEEQGEYHALLAADNRRWAAENGEQTR